MPTIGHLPPLADLATYTRAGSISKIRAHGLGTPAAPAPYVLPVTVAAGQAVIRVALEGGTIAQDVTARLYGNAAPVQAGNPLVTYANGPDTLISSFTKTIAAGAALDYVDFVLPDAIPAGSVWLALDFGPSGNAQYLYTTDGTQWYRNSGAPTATFNIGGSTGAPFNRLVAIGLSYPDTATAGTTDYIPTADPVVPGAIAGRFFPDHGPNTWAGNNTIPNNEPGITVTHPQFFRRPTMRVLNPAPGVYDWGELDDLVTSARNVGGAANIAMRTMKGGVANAGIHVPDFIADPAKGHGQWVNGTWLPNWDNEEVLQAQITTIYAMGARYNRSPYVWFVDARIWGTYGENTGYRDGNLPTHSMLPANRIRILDAWREAFPDVQIILPYGDPEMNRYAVKLSLADQPIPIGIRGDGQGNFNFQEQWDRYRSRYPGDADFDNAWKTRPVMGEPWNRPDPALYKSQVAQYHIMSGGNGNLGTLSNYTAAQIDTLQEAQAAMGYKLRCSRVRVTSSVASGATLTIVSDWHNDGVAPRYRPTTVTWGLFDAGGTLRWSAIAPGTGTSVRLRLLLPTGGAAAQFTDAFTMPALSAGTYTLRVRVDDTRTIGQTAAVPLWQQGRQTGTNAGWYNLNTAGAAATIAVTGTGGTTTAPTVDSVGAAGNTGAAAATSLVCAVPASPNGKLLVWPVGYRGGSGTTPTPAASGWTTYGPYNDGTSRGLVIYTRTGTASEPASYTLNLSPAQTAGGAILAIGGFHPSASLTVSTLQSNASSSNVTHPTLTTPVDTMLVLALAVASGAGNFTTSPTSYTERVDTTTAAASGNALVGVFSGTQATAGATGTLTSVMNTAMASSALTIAVAPVPIAVAPAAVTDFLMTVNSGTAITDTWTPTANTTSQRIVATGSDGTSNTQVFDGTTNSYLWSGLTPGVTYTHTHTAFNGSIPSPSVTKSATTTVPIPVPGAPGELAIINTTASGIEIQYSAPGGPVTSFNTRYRIVGAPGWTAGPSTTDTTIVIGSLADDTRYEIQVQAVNVSGPGAWSGSVFGWTQPLPPAAPISSFIATVLSYAEVRLNWTLTAAAADSTTADITYTERGPGALTHSTPRPLRGILPISGTSLADSITQTTHRGTAPGTEYIYTHQGYGDGGAAPPVVSLSVTTPTIPGPIDDIVTGDLVLDLTGGTYQSTSYDPDGAATGDTVAETWRVKVLGTTAESREAARLVLEDTLTGDHERTPVYRRLRWPGTSDVWRSRILSGVTDNVEQHRAFRSHGYLYTDVTTERQNYWEWTTERDLLLRNNADLSVPVASVPGLPWNGLSRGRNRVMIEGVQLGGSLAAPLSLAFTNTSSDPTALIIIGGAAGLGYTTLHLKPEDGEPRIQNTETKSDTGASGGTSTIHTWQGPERIALRAWEITPEVLAAFGGRSAQLYLRLAGPGVPDLRVRAYLSRGAGEFVSGEEQTITSADLYALGPFMLAPVGRPGTRNYAPLLLVLEARAPRSAPTTTHSLTIDYLQWLPLQYHRIYEPSVGGFGGIQPGETLVDDGTEGVVYVRDAQGRERYDYSVRGRNELEPRTDYTFVVLQANNGPSAPITKTLDLRASFRARRRGL